MRSSTHITDTKAVRKVIAALPADWLIRSLEERDYGIDMFIETFTGSEATGQTAMVQIKGTESGFKKSAKISFPTRTIEYALLFQQPFFVFHVSLLDESIRFVWLQKYVDMVLEKKPNWRNQGHVTIRFPRSNDLAKNSAKINEILKKSACRDEAIKVITAVELAARAWISARVLVDSDQISFIEKQISDMKKCKRFWEMYPLTGHVISDLDSTLAEMRSNIVSYGEDERDQLEYANSDLASGFDDFFIAIKSSCEMFQDEIIGDDFQYREGGIIPF